MLDISFSRDLKALIEPIYPNLINRAKKYIEESERRYSAEAGDERDSFLWEHTTYVAAIAQGICLEEGIDPINPVIAALFHDAGKFSEGTYHADEIPEEELAAQIANKMLAEEGMVSVNIKVIVDGLVSLYSKKKEKNVIANIIHDADFLAKMGHIGVANFHIKAALRGQNLSRSLIQSLSKELTYVSLLPENMRTAAGCSMAEAKSRETLHHFYGLLKELRDHGISRFVITEFEWPCPKNPQRTLNIIMALPENCPSCSSEITTEYSSKDGVKCTELKAEIRCTQCSNEYQISFCLPEICP